MRRLLSNDQGAVIVEFAIILPLLAMLVCGTIEMGLLFYNKQVLANATREGARFQISKFSGAYDEDSEDDDLARQIVADYCNNMILISLGAGGNPVDIDDVVLSKDTDYRTLSISYDYYFLFGSIIGFPKTRIYAETTMRRDDSYDS